MANHFNEQNSREKKIESCLKSPICMVGYISTEEVMVHKGRTSKTSRDDKILEG